MVFRWLCIFCSNAGWERGHAWDHSTCWFQYIQTHFARIAKCNLNVSKCSVMWFWSRSKLPSSPPDICIDGVPLQVVDNQKYLGVIFDNTLQWSEVCKKKCLFFILDKLLLTFSSNRGHQNANWLSHSVTPNLCLASLGYNVNFSTLIAIKTAVQLGSAYCYLFKIVWPCVISLT